MTANHPAFLLSFLLVATLLSASKGALGCRDKNGNPVDWWIVLKAPQTLESHQTTGLPYGYLSSSAPSFVWDPNTNINDSSPLFHTITAINNAPTIAKTVYNDSVPNQGEFYNFAHMKGFLTTDGHQGVYMMHSFPSYPIVNDNGYIDPTVQPPQLMYGQYAFCMTVSDATVAEIARILVVSNPKVYAGDLLNQFSAGERLKADGVIKTVGGEEVELVAHNGQLDTSYFENVLSPVMGVGFQVQSWGRPYEQSFCDQKYQEVNIWKLMGDDFFAWSSYDDHSKWSISIDNTLPFTCMNDNNRMHSQNVRGGGSGCLRNPAVFSAFYNLSVEFYNCSDDSDVEEMGGRMAPIPSFLGSEA
eukprot:CAMPEP_0114989470 /NCGR_PEP_ID=MMETSP0216-20121206/10216_1 /TAXON_ID=223996 /ORGANISM="Protocruzia adherens, Strain Boccale" /LENGTH=358 /DNA_ID=CAMNT_0002352453 /DNA_START=81 /DNA_END=1157 /DNA_ORIENTATION=+